MSAAERWRKLPRKERRAALRDLARLRREIGGDSLAVDYRLRRVRGFGFKDLDRLTELRRRVGAVDAVLAMLREAERNGG